MLARLFSAYEWIEIWNFRANTNNNCLDDGNRQSRGNSENRSQECDGECMGVDRNFSFLFSGDAAQQKQSHPHTHTRTRRFSFVNFWYHCFDALMPSSIVIICRKHILEIVVSAFDKMLIIFRMQSASAQIVFAAHFFLFCGFHAVLRTIEISRGLCIHYECVWRWRRLRWFSLLTWHCVSAAAAKRHMSMRSRSLDFRRDPASVTKFITRHRIRIDFEFVTDRIWAIDMHFKNGQIWVRRISPSTESMPLTSFREWLLLRLNSLRVNCNVQTAATDEQRSISKPIFVRRTCACTIHDDGPTATHHRYGLLISIGPSKVRGAVERACRFMTIIIFYDRKSYKEILSSHACVCVWVCRTILRSSILTPDPVRAHMVHVTLIASTAILYLATAIKWRAQDNISIFLFFSSGEKIVVIILLVLASQHLATMTCACDRVNHFYFLFIFGIDCKMNYFVFFFVFLPLHVRPLTFDK